LISNAPIPSNIPKIKNTIGDPGIVPNGFADVVLLDELVLDDEELVDELDELDVELLDDVLDEEELDEVLEDVVEFVGTPETVVCPVVSPP
jgi:hypothetical protein